MSTNNNKIQITNTKPITEAQRKVLLFINTYVDKNMYPPSYRDIGEHLGFASTNAVTNHLMVLEAKGLVKTARGKARALWLTPLGKQSIKD